MDFIWLHDVLFVQHSCTLYLDVFVVCFHSMTGKVKRKVQKKHVKPHVMDLYSRFFVYYYLVLM